jgi:hypothetical protein
MASTVRETAKARRETDDQGIGRGPAGLGLVPAPRRDRAEHRGARHDDAVAQREFRDRYQDLSGGRKFTPERGEQGLQTRQQEKQEEEDHPACHDHHEEWVGEGGGELALEIALLGEVGDEPLQHLVERPRRLARLDQVLSRGIENLGHRRHRGGKRGALADAIPEPTAELTQPRLLDAQREQAQRLARREAR